MTHEEFADSLVEIAAFYREHPEVPLPYIGRASAEMPIYAVPKDDWPKIMRAFGNCEKRIGETFFRLVKKFGAIELHATDYRENICTRKVLSVEIKHVEKQVPASYKTEIVKEVIEHVEWDCSASILALTP